ncbi:hypothetical protein QP978_09545 [Corynebacterium sp. MSK035]|uniref:hypothetical protein n=1 Tax=Corynebacterium TaxID=1716 RepID=UPI00124422FB|nr:MULTISPECIES: hypothetical protein [Corynebacterium]KAA9226411.1 hypothetical protein F6I42_05340 [Corynebacterium amycolatum]MDK8811150.1 hypothetical protein [Corynebacterium sp. MSK035]
MNDLRLRIYRPIRLILDSYQVKKDKGSGIVNDPNDWADEVGNPRYIVDLIGRVVRVAMETVRIVNDL